MNDIKQLMKDANPVLDSHASLTDDEFADLLAFTVAMDDANVEVLPSPLPTAKKSYNGLLVAAVAAAIVILIGVGILLITPTDDLEPAEPTPTTTVAPTTSTTLAAIVEQDTDPTTTTSLAPAPVVSDEQAATIAAYEAAWNEGDEDAFRAVFAPGAMHEEEIFQSGADVDRILEWSAGRRTMEVAISVTDCTATEDAVICTVEFDGVVMTAMNFMPMRDRYVFTFDDGQISHVDVTCQICWDPVAEDRLKAWVQSQDESAVDSLNLGYNFVFTEENAAAWLEWAPKWQEAGRP